MRCQLPWCQILAEMHRQSYYPPCGLPADPAKGDGLWLLNMLHEEQTECDLVHTIQRFNRVAREPARYRGRPARQDRRACVDGPVGGQPRPAQLARSVQNALLYRHAANKFTRTQRETSL